VSWINAWWQRVSATVVDGLQVTAIGMALVFLTLGIIIVALIVLARLPGSRPKTTTKEQPVATHSPPAETVKSAAADAVRTAPEQGRGADLAQVAAIAVALLRSQRAAQPRSQANLSSSRWKQYGRAHQLGL
jgi:Na+-transporting methylmalonyl-CoA/oxaloacetate decarboxylase gamma subunit